MLDTFDQLMVPDKLPEPARHKMHVLLTEPNVQIMTKLRQALDGVNRLDASDTVSGQGKPKTWCMA